MSMPATQTAATVFAASTKTVTVGSADANGKFSNRAFHAAGTAAYWWLRDDTSGEFIELGARHRGDRDFEVSLDLTIGHDYTVGAGRGRDAVRGEFTILP